MAEETDWKSVAVRLWALLDDIDTADDVAKDDDAAFRRIAQQRQRKRFDVLSGEAWDAARAETADSPTPCETLIIEGFANGPSEALSASGSNSSDPSVEQD